MDFSLYRQIQNGDAQYFNEVLGQAMKHKQLNLLIHCVGGNVFEATAMYNGIKRSITNGLTVVATVEGVAASMAVPLIASCSRVRMRKSARLMIHEITIPNTGGNAQKMQANAEMIESWNDSYAGTVAAKTGKTKEFVRETWMKPNIDTWFTAEEALQVGLVDEIIEDGQKLDGLLMATLQPEALTGTFDAYFKTVSNTQKLVKMEELHGFCAEVGIEIPEGVTDTKTAITIMTAKYQNLQSENARLTQAVEDYKLADLNALMDSKGIPTKKRKNYLDIAASSGIPSVVALLEGIADTKITLKSRQDWDYNKWETEDPQGLLEMMSREPQAYQSLLAKY